MVKELEKIDIPVRNHCDKLGDEFWKVFWILKLLSSPDKDDPDRVALRCWLGILPGEEERKRFFSAWRSLREHCRQKDDLPWKALENLCDGSLPGFNEKDGQILRERFESLCQKMKEVEGLEDKELIDKVLPQGAEWSQRFRPCFEGFEGGVSELAEKIEENILRPDEQEDSEEDSKKVRIMTLYKSKGLTADLVIICHCSDGNIPRKGGNIDLEEERRLFYVAITRTRKILVLSRIKGKKSQFIGELGKDCPEIISGEEFLEKKGCQPLSKTSKK